MLIPALDLIDGNVVRLKQGDFAQQTTFHNDPLPIVQQYEDAGAKWLHLVDLDGARDTSKRQLELLRTITASTKMNVQIGGGIRTSEDVRNLMEIGVERVVVGSTAVSHPELVRSWLAMFGSEAIVLALDVNLNDMGEPMVATHGWLNTSNKSLAQVLEMYQDDEVKHVLCTDISRDGMLSGSNIELYAKLKKQYPQIAWQASGGVRDLTDLRRLRAVNCDAAILGKALLTGQFTLREALACWPNE